MKTITLTLGLCFALTACSLDGGNVDVRCQNAIGEDGAAFFCGNPVSGHTLGIELGSATEISMGSETSADNLDVTSVSATDLVHTSMLGTDAFTLVANQIGQTEVTVYDPSGVAVDRVGVVVSGCDNNVGEHGVAAFCGDFDSNHVLAIAMMSTARIRVFTPTYGRLDIAGVGSSDWSKVSVSIPATGPGAECDPDFDYCTNVVELVAYQLGTVDIGIDDANGQLIDQVTVNVIDHW